VRAVIANLLDALASKIRRARSDAPYLLYESRRFFLGRRIDGHPGFVSFEYKAPMNVNKTFRNVCWLWLCAFAVSIALTVRGQPDTNTMKKVASLPKTIVVLGDSIAAGMGVDPSEAYPALLQEKINSAGLNFTVVNAGVSGDTTADGLNRINWLLRRPIDVLILELGGNDGLRGFPVPTIATNLQMIIDRMKQKNPRAKIVIAGMRMPPNLGETYTTAYKNIFPELAKKNHAALVPFVLEGVGGKPELNQSDHVHPTAAGHRIVAENVWKVLKPVLAAPVRAE
jgi:acyl-CoA thioesterase-1